MSMKPVYHGEYNDDVNEKLAIRRTPSTVLRFGAEVETGWHSAEQRNRFLTKLSEEGLGEKVISKFDRSIQAAECAEIVTLPMKHDDLAETLTTIGRLLENETNRSIMAGCGVHIHASAGAMTTDQKWRAVSAIMVGKNPPECLAYRQTHDEMKAWSEKALLIDDFWTRIALRHPGPHCGRQQYSNVEQLTGSKGVHRLAVIPAKRTPTVEFRLFKSARSPKVLSSYPEVVAALISFSANPPEELLEPADKEALAAAERHRLAVDEFERLWWEDDAELLGRVANINGWDRDESDYHRTRGWRFASWGPGRIIHQMVVNGYTYTKMKNHGMYELDQLLLPRAFYEKLYALRSDLVPPARRVGDVGAQAWRNHLFPLRAFTEYVAHNAETYPSLAERLELPKFAVHTGREVLGKNGTDETPFPDEARAHARIETGCIVRDQSDNGTIYRVERVIANRGAKTAEDYTAVSLQVKRKSDSPKGETYYSSEPYNFTFDNLIHLCSGATRREGHDE